LRAVLVVGRHLHLHKVEIKQCLPGNLLTLGSNGLVIGSSSAHMSCFVLIQG